MTNQIFKYIFHMETTTLTKKPRKKKVLVKRKRDRLQLITDLIKNIVTRPEGAEDF